MKTQSVVVVIASVSLLLLSVIPGDSRGAASPEELVGSISGQNLEQTIQHLQDFGSRAFYLNSSRDAATYIYDQFSALGLYVRYQPFMALTHPVVNVIAILNGSDTSAPAYLFGAHYDSENMDATNYSLGLNLTAPGADDDASGVAAVIELARVLAPLHFNRTIMFVAFGAEELGYDWSGALKGSSAFVLEESGAGQQFAATAILDMIGYKRGSANNITFIVENPADPFEMAAVQSILTYNLELDPTTIINASMTYSDHAPFWWAGYPSMLVIEQMNPFNPYYHSSNDTIDKLNRSLMVETTRALLGALLSLNPIESVEVPEFPFPIAVAALVCVFLVPFYLRSAKED